VQAASRAYLAGLHRCVVERYAALTGGRPHPLAPLVAAAAERADKQAAAPRAAPKVVLIERSGSRAVHNAAELRSALGSVLPPGALHVFGAADGGSQAEHLRRFANADVVVAPHGAGQTNALVAWPGTVMMEFIPEAGLANLVYTQMCLLLGQGFTSFTPPGGSYYGGFHVDAGRVAEAVAGILGTGGAAATAGGGGAGKG
jgi:hypothetical protein